MTQLLYAESYAKNAILNEADEEESCYVQNIDLEYREVYEFWHVSDFFADKLRENGETVTEILDFNVWSRCTSGQAIMLDSVIETIARDMEILSGQAYEWSK